MTIDDRGRTETDEHVGTLLSQAARQISDLAREEVRLVRTEFAAHRRNLGFGGGLLGGAGLMGFIAVQAVAAAVIAGLAEALPVWAAALVVGGAAGVAAAGMALLGKKRVERAAPVVGETVDNVKADVAAIKDSGR